MTERMLETYEPILSMRTDLKELDICLMEEWGMSRLGVEVPTEHDGKAYVWFGTQPNMHKEIPVIGAAAPYGHDISSEETRWFWGLASEDDLTLGNNMYAALLDHATHVTTRPTMVIDSLQTEYERGKIIVERTRIILPEGRHDQWAN